MRLTTKGRYAVTAMLDLAIHHDKGAVSLAQISARQKISLSYLEQLFAQLRRKALVVSTRGPGGGYSLSRSPQEISIAQIIDAIEEHIDATQCGGQLNCQDDSPCLTHYLWQDLSVQIRNFLTGISLGNLLAQPHVKQVAMWQNSRTSAQSTH